LVVEIQGYKISSLLWCFGVRSSLTGYVMGRIMAFRRVS